MWSWVLSFALTGIAPAVPEGLPVAPFDIEVGRQVVELRKPLVARAEGARLVLYIRELANLGVTGRDIVGGFETAVPEGSVTAYLTGLGGEQLTLEHTGYSFYRGHAGLVLTEADAPGRSEMYRHLELDAKLPLKGVHAVWLDRVGRRVQDVRPSL